MEGEEEKEGEKDEEEEDEDRRRRRRRRRRLFTAVSRLLAKLRSSRLPSLLISGGMTLSCCRSGADLRRACRHLVVEQVELLQVFEAWQ